MPKAEQLIEIIQRLQDTVKTVKKQPGEWWEKLDKIVVTTVKEVEFVYDDLKGEDKKAIAQEVCVELYFKHFNQKWIPDFLERPMAKKLISYIVDKAIEAAVSLFNRTGVFKKEKS